MEALHDLRIFSNYSTFAIYRSLGDFSIVELTRYRRELKNEAAVVRVKLSLTNIIAKLSDILGACLLAVYALFIGPLGFLRGPIVLERGFWYVWVLLPLGMLARSVRVAIDWRMGHFDLAISQSEGLISAVEEYYQQKPSANGRRRVLADLYTLLARAYMHGGHIDEAMQVVIRAKKVLGVNRLSGLSELDAKTAHLVRAGLAAGRLLEGGGLATMFVRTEPQPSFPQNQKVSEHAEKKGATIIPFPTHD